jgi:hypothetical protein
LSHVPAPVPMMLPGEALVPMTWDCDGASIVQRNSLGQETGQVHDEHCVVTKWAVTSAPAGVVEVQGIDGGPVPVVEQSPRPFAGTVTASAECGTTSTEPCVVEAGAATFSTMHGAAALMVLLLAALVVAQLRSR